MSIIPGMENLAPDRTLTSSGSTGSPSCLPIFFSSRARARLTSAVKAVGPPAVHVGPAGVGGDGEAVGHRQAQHRRHLGQVGPLAAEEVLQLHGRPTMRMVEVVDERHGGLLAVPRRARVAVQGPPDTTGRAGDAQRRRRPAISSAMRSIGTRTCSVVSRSRTVTAPSSRESKSTVTQYGVPTSSWRR